MKLKNKKRDIKKQLKKEKDKLRIEYALMAGR
jgi:hypothetical protein